MQSKIVQAVFENLAEQKRHDDAERQAAGIEFARRLQLTETYRPFMRTLEGVPSGA